jgi:hypothetical protein
MKWISLPQVRDTWRVFMNTAVRKAVFWVVAQCSPVQVYRSLRAAHRLDDVGTKRLCTSGHLVPDCTMLQPTRQPFSQSPPREPEILASSISRTVISWLSEELCLLCEQLGVK